MYRRLIFIGIIIFTLFMVWSFFKSDSKTTNQIETLLTDINEGNLTELPIPIQDAEIIKSYYDYAESLDAESFTTEIVINEEDTNNYSVIFLIREYEEESNDIVSTQRAEFFVTFGELDGALRIVDIEFAYVVTEN